MTFMTTDEKSSRRYLIYDSVENCETEPRLIRRAIDGPAS